MLQSLIDSENKFSFDQLSSTQFEEFCFELLGCLGFININWRKGTGHTSSPSDQGRDIECERIVKELDGEVTIEKWFVECKHYISGVSPDKIQSVLSWANSKRPDKVLVIASNFLSNQCKNYINEYIRDNRPPFKIKYWERPKLEELTQSQSLLLKKYGIGFNLSFINIIHPNHLIYIKDLHFFTLDSFFKIMDGIEPATRDKILQFPYSFIIKPKARKPTTKKETLGDLLIDDISYENFKAKCYETEKRCNNIDVANYVTDIILKFCIAAGDITTLDQKIKNLESIKESLQKKLLNGYEVENHYPKDVIKSTVNKLTYQINKMSDETEEYNSIYILFCEHVLPALFLEETLDMLKLDLNTFKFD
ncbi:restriction endonuclease [Methanosarcina sp.]|uniref:restriction endonuclease n=1 Tax=Methanosarcina sp. TaxID=2213 RepID=UPI0029898911|nr:restriction endonuclease [Methanosarcina sp.]MDW5552297.1 restriction endonuclease [Methanosarcina sp.]